MLSTAQIASHLERITYRPGWTITAQDDEWEGQQIRIVAPVPNSYRPGQTVDLGITSFLPPMQTTADLERWLIWRLARIENHEAREFFRVDGHIRYDPHAHA
jgi:hypothetical protein